MFDFQELVLSLEMAIQLVLSDLNFKKSKLVFSRVAGAEGLDDCHVLPRGYQTAKDIFLKTERVVIPAPNFLEMFIYASERINGLGIMFVDGLFLVGQLGVIDGPSENDKSLPDALAKLILKLPK